MRNLYLGKSIDGKLSLGSDTNRALFQQDLKEHPNATYRIERTIPKRTNQQNRYFWFYLELVEMETGNDKQALHEYVKKYLTPKVERTVKLLENGQWKEHKGMIGKGTSECNKIEMGDVLDKLCALTGVPLPNPEDAGYILN